MYAVMNLILVHLVRQINFYLSVIIVLIKLITSGSIKSQSVR